jgi:hypothetical protein
MPMNEANEKFGKWLYKKYTEWLTEQDEEPQNSINETKKKYRNMGGYCQYLKISRAMFSQYIHYHSKPSRRGIHALAAIYGNEVYSELGITPPSPDIEEVIENWGKLNGEEKIKIMATIRSKKER